MKHSFLIAIKLLVVMVSLIPTFVWGQKVYLTISVKPVDEVYTNTTLSKARVSLLSAKDSMLIDTLRRERVSYETMEQYQYVYFSKDVTLPAEYIVKMECEGYETKFVKISIKPEDADHGQFHYGLWGVKMKRERSQKLGEAVVTASKVMMVMKGDTLVYNADAFQLSDGSMLDELIKQLPGVKLERGGRITVNGHFVSSLLVDGKDFFKGDPNVALQNLPAYMVNKVKAYQKIPENAYITRPNDEKGPREDDPWVLDVALKKEFAQGIIANAEVAHDVYQSSPFLGRLFGMMFRDRSRLAVYATGNNINMNGSPQTDSGNWMEFNDKSGRTKRGEGGLSFYTESKNRKVKYNADVKASGERTDLEQFSSHTSFLPQTDYAYTTSKGESRDKSIFAAWYNSLTLRASKIYTIFSPDFSYRYGRRRSRYLSAEGNQLLRMEGLDSVITDGNCGMDFLNLVNRVSMGNTRTWTAGGSVSNSISLRSLHLNGLSVSFWYNYKNEKSHDWQHYNMTTKQTVDRRNRYDKSPNSSYMYFVQLLYPIVDIQGARVLNTLPFSYTYRQQFSSGGRSLYRLDSLGGDWLGNATALGSLPSTNLMERCLDPQNSFRRTSLLRRHQMSLSWTFFKNRPPQINISLPLIVESERLSEWRPKGRQAIERKQVYTEPSFSIRWFDNFTFGYNAKRQTPSQTLMLDVIDNSNPLTIFKGNPDLKSSISHSLSAVWRTRKESNMRQTLLSLNMDMVKNAVGQLRQFNSETGGYTYTPYNIDGNRSVTLSGNYSQAVDEKKHWMVNAGANFMFYRSVDFAAVGIVEDFQKSVVHNLHLTPSVGVDYRFSKWHVSFKASADWERLTSDREDFVTTSQTDMLYTLGLNAPLPWDISLNTDFNAFIRRGYSDPTMNTDEYVWNATLTRSLDRRKTLLLKLSAHDLLGQLSSVRRDLNAQGRTETRTNTLTRYVMLHLVWKFNKKPKGR